MKSKCRMTTMKRQSPFLQPAAPSERMELGATDSQVGRQRKEDPSGGLTNGALTQWRWGYWDARGSWEVLSLVS